MARERMVTRTIESWNVEALVAYPKAMQMATARFYIPGHIKQNNFLKYLQANYNNDEQSIISVTASYLESTVYGMPESEFIHLAKILDR